MKCPRKQTYVTSWITCRNFFFNFTKSTYRATPIRLPMLALARRTFRCCTVRPGPVRDIIVEKLAKQFTPSFLNVECESEYHAGGKGQERHFYVQIASKKFEKLNTVQMHRLVNNCLIDELNGPVHALRIDAYPSSKFDDDGPSDAPECEKLGK